MKNITLLFLFLYLNNTCFATSLKTLQNSIHEASAISSDLQLEKNLHLSKLLIIPTIITTTVLLNTSNVIESIKKYPISFLTLSCLLYNYLADTVIKYKQIHNVLHLFLLSKTMNRYMLYVVAIKNTMLEISKKSNAIFFKSDEEYYQTITSQIPLSFTELQTFISELSQNCNNSLHNLHLIVNNDLEDQICSLCKEHITTKDILYLCKQDKEFYPYLQNFYKNPTQHYQTTIMQLSALIKKHLQYMLKHQHYFS